MKTKETYTLTFLTPCFCAGANQSTAEIRPSAIRGQLRWWFRALGGTREEERNVFGGIGKKEEDVRSSAVVIRVSNIEPGKQWNPPPVNQNDTSSYVWYFASVSGTEGHGKTGPRWNSTAVISPESTFKLRLLFQRPLPEQLEAKFQDTLTCFLMLGGIGLRVTRGLGAFHCQETPFSMEIIRPILQGADFAIEDQGLTGGLDATVKRMGSLVKGTRKVKGWTNDAKNKTETPSPMGTSGKRQTSAIYFRPVKHGNGLQLIVFEAPHTRVLGEESRELSKTVGRQPSQLVEAVVQAARY